MSEEWQVLAPEHQGREDQDRLWEKNTEAGARYLAQHLGFKVRRRSVDPWVEVNYPEPANA